MHGEGTDVVERRDIWGREEAGKVHQLEKTHYFEKQHTIKMNFSSFQRMGYKSVRPTDFVTRPKQTSRSTAPSPSFLP